MAILRSFIARRRAWGTPHAIGLALALCAGGGALRANPASAAFASLVIAAALGGHVIRLRARGSRMVRRLHEAEELQRVTAEIAGADTTRAAAGHVLLSLRRQFDFTAAAILPAREEHRALAWSMTANGRDATITPIAPRDDGVDDRLGLRIGHSVTDLGGDSSELDQFLPACRSAVTVPIVLPGGVRTALLALGLPDRRPFTSDELGWLATFASGVASPLEAVRLHEEVACLAFSDPMTGLANYRGFERHIDEECARADRYQHPVALLMLDLDHFKRVNDCYGHPAGDAVLRHVGEVLRSHVRSIDIPARYGGEEFAVICPETDIDEALVLAERLRLALEMSDCLLPSGERLAVTVSVGAAVLRAGMGLKAELVAEADCALYEAKRAGRNRVRSSQACGLTAVA
jgi:diguanylate cyclase (GGDEF)-like protein